MVYEDMKAFLKKNPATLSAVMNDEISFHPGENLKTPIVTGWKTSKTGASAGSCGGANKYLHGTMKTEIVLWRETAKKKQGTAAGSQLIRLKTG